MRLDNPRLLVGLSILSAAVLLLIQLAMSETRDATSSIKLNEAIAAMRSGKPIAELNLADCGLTRLPDEIFLPNVVEHLEFLNLGGNAISSLPNSMGELRKLRILFFANNQFSEIPEVLGSLPSLYMLSFKDNKLHTIPETALAPSIRWLILTGNQLESLPRSIGRLKGLRKLMLSINRLSSLPDELGECKELELLRLAGNKLEALPPWLLSMPHLSWLALSGNPLPELAREGAPRVLPSAEWSSISLKDKIGEGASGSVYIAESSISDSPVAVKLFKSAGTRSCGSRFIISSSDFLSQ